VGFPIRVLLIEVAARQFFFDNTDKELAAALVESAAAALDPG
jgi:hypothetical protein